MTRGPQQILVATHHRENGVQLRRVLEPAGYEVQVVATLEEFDAILDAVGTLDLALVDISGFDATIWSRCEALRAAGVPFLIVAGRSKAAVKEAGSAYGAGGVLVKPLMVSELLTLVRLMTRN